MINNYSISRPAIKTKLISHSEKNHTLEIQPLLPGFGHTLGNSLRRVFLSSIPGFAVTKIRINDLTHEYQSIPGVVEDAMDVILNLKLLRCRILTDENSAVLQIHKTTPGDVTAADFDKNSRVSIANEDLYIAHLDKGFNLDIEVEITRGHGYLPLEGINLANATNPQDILVDAVFSPVTNVGFEVDKVRVGDNTNFDKISINFETDKTVLAQEVVEYSVSLIQDLFSNIKSSLETSLDIQMQTPVMVPKESEVISTNSENDDEIDLPARVKNVLEKNGILTNSELKTRTNELDTMPGVGASTLTLIRDYIKSIS